MHAHYFRGQPDCSIRFSPEFAPSLPIHETQEKNLMTQKLLVATFNISLPSTVFGFVLSLYFHILYKHNFSVVPLTLNLYWIALQNALV